jgi:hypothetical protein
VSDVDLSKLREPFKGNEVGKLPRVTCPNCSSRSKQCTEHDRIWCDVCKSKVSERHIHIDFVGHGDTTIRLLDVDEAWTWEPMARDVDPAVLAAAAASGNPEIVQMILRNAPPKFDLDKDGNPVGMWMYLTVGGVTRPGYGSVPSTQDDAVKVLIGDGLRNSAMRFGVALDLWANGERADPTAENASASAGRAKRGGGRPSAGDAWDQSTPARPAQQDSDRPQSPVQSADIDAKAVDEWAAKIDEITSSDDADRTDADLKEVFKGGRMNAATANAIRKAIRAKRDIVTRMAADRAAS